MKAPLTAAAVFIAATFTLTGCGGIGWITADPPPPPTRTSHEGIVSKVIVDDPHEGGWSGRASDPTSVLLTVAGVEYDLAGSLRQAGTVKPGDRVRIECVQYDTMPEPSCSFGGIIIGEPSSKATEK